MAIADTLSTVCTACCLALVDRDQNPKWNPAHIEDVTQEKLDWYFSPLPDGQELILTD